MITRQLRTRIAALLGVFVLMATLALFTGGSVGALDPVQAACEGPGAASDVCATDGGNPLVGPNGVITRATNVISIATGMIALIVIVLAGLSYAKSGGNSGQLSQARDAIIYAGVALAVAALAQVIVRFVLSSLQ